MNTFEHLFDRLRSNSLEAIQSKQQTLHVKPQVLEISTNASLNNTHP